MDSYEASPLLPEAKEAVTSPPPFRTVRGVVNLPTERMVLSHRDRVELCYERARTKIESRVEWLGPTGILLTVLVTLLTADIKSRGWIPAAVIQGTLLVIASSAATWLGLMIRSRLREGGPLTTDEFIASLEEGAPKFEPEPRSRPKR